MTITICASVDFTPDIIRIKKELEKLNHHINIPYYSQKIMNGEISYRKYMQIKKRNGDTLLRKAESTDMIKRYWNLIKNSDAILVLNMSKKGINNYIGGNTLMEMGFAYGFNKKIFLFNPIPQNNERMHYIDEIIDMKPIVLNRNLTILK